jgi:hypothetical protein
MAVDNWPNGDYSQAMGALESRIAQLKQEMGVA